MNTRCAALLSTLALAGGLTACAEKSQSTDSARKVDDKAWHIHPGAFAAANWTGGDEPAWQNQMRSRAQNQNEYTRAPAASQTNRTSAAAVPAAAATAAVVAPTVAASAVSAVSAASAASAP